MASHIDLWDNAFKLLPPDICASLERARSHKLDILGAVLQEAESKSELSLRKRWKVTKPNGEVVIVRDVLEKIVAWIHRFKETGDTLVQYDPSHAALPWAAVRFLLQMAISEVQVFGAMAEELENTARMLVRYRIFEKTYLAGPQSETQLTMKEALVRLYAEILTFLGTALSFYRERSIVRILKGPFRCMDEVRSNTLNEREQEVNALASLFDAETLQSLQIAFTRLSTESSKALSEDRFQEILDWLCVAPYHHHHQYIAQSRLSGAGQWLLQHPKFMAWQTSSSPSLLLIHGIPGSGKSTLCSVFIDFLQSAVTTNPAAAPFGYFYCANPQSERSRRCANDIMRTILFQLSIDTVHRTKMRDCLSCEYERQVSLARAGRFDMAQLCVADSVRLILEIAEQDPLTIVIDGLDSIDDAERLAVMGALEELIVKADNVVKIFVTSRGTNRSASKPVAEFEIQITSEETKEDMETFVDHLVAQSVTKKKLLQGNLHSDTENMLKGALLAGSHEMFLWARLQVERICRETVEADVIAALRDNPPQDLDLLYQESLDCISHAGEAARDIAMKVILCVLHIREPLTPQAVLMALASEKDSVLDLTQILVICANLVVLDTKCNSLRFSHQSVQDFLTRHREFSPAAAHHVLSSLCIRACLRGLNSASFAGLQIPSDDFYVYAAMYWAVHSKLALTFGKDTAIIESVEASLKAFLFDEEWDTTLSFESWIENARQIASILPREHAMKRSMCAVSSSDFEFVFTLSMFGLESILREALANISDVDINLPNDSGYTPIYLAAALGQSATVSLLLECGSNINVKCGTHGSPLHVACFSGHLEVVKKLLQHGADMSCGAVYGSAFEAACRGRREDIAVHLIEAGLSITGAGDYEKVFDSAALVGFVKVVQRLQTPDFSALNTTKATRARTETKIRKAIQGGQTGVLRQFLGQNPNSRDFIPSDAVALATLFNHKSMIEFLLDIGMDIEANGDFGSPLRTAALLNYQSTVRLLVDKGAQIEACGPFGDSLQTAAMNGNSYIVRLLIDEGAPVNQETGFYGSALQAAAYHGHSDTVQVLLHARADIYQPGLCKDAFEAASRGGQDHVAELLQQKCNGRDPSWITIEPMFMGPPAGFPSELPLSVMETFFESAISSTEDREKQPEDVLKMNDMRTLEYDYVLLSAWDKLPLDVVRTR